MTDLRNIPFARPWITADDRKAVMEVLDGHILAHGPQCKAFETEFAAFLGDGAHCVAVSSCMAALHLAYLHFNIGPGDEVIVPAQTHTATAHAVEWAGAKPIFVDCDLATGNLTADAIADAISPRTRAISVVHFLGIPCDMPAIMAIAERHGLKVVEDCALAVGARFGGRHVGLFGDVGCFSFYPVKHITTGEGGMFVTRHPAVAEAVARLRAFGVDRTHTERSVPGMYDVPSLGLNYRMSELQAALGRTQLRRIEVNLERRRANFNALKQGLKELSDIHILDPRNRDAKSSHYCLSVVWGDKLQGQRNELAVHLNEAGIGTSIYYPQPVPRMSYYRNKYGYDAGAFHRAAQISDQSVALPVGPHVTADDIKYIADKLSSALMEVKI
ncbi:MAG: DegT/DnrJ/EryC1/StrS family aminotransferase [Candidatus Tectomicrobia bacterium]